MYDINYKGTHYCIKRHIKGDKYENDCFVLDKKYAIRKFLYKESARYICGELNKKYTAFSFYVVRCEHGDILR